MKKAFFVRVLPLIVALCALFTVPCSWALASAPVNPATSRMSAEMTTLKADGLESTRITVTVRDTNYDTPAGKVVTLISSRGSLDEINVENAITDILGKAYFRVASLKDGEVTFSAQVDGITLQRGVLITYHGGLVGDIHDGDLIKIPDDNNASTLSDTAVYYYGANGKRYVFPNEKVYFTWYPSFAGVKVITQDQMSVIPIGGNATYHPGSKLVKFQTDTKTYLPTKGGKLRWVQTEVAAKGLFGANWNTKVDDISEAFYVNYTFGDPIATAGDAPLDIIGSTAKTIDIDKGLGQ
jgi:hypothetical protein